MTQSYTEGGADVTITPATGFTTWDALFSNTDTSNCPITSCSIADSGNCGGTLTGTEVSLGSSSPWDVSMLVDDPVGYTKTICVQCVNADDSVDLDSWVINLDAGSCASALTPQPLANIDNTYDWVSSSDTTTPTYFSPNL